MTDKHDHGRGVIGSAMMPISDLFPAAGITFWDCAHEVNAGMSADGYTQATGKMSMAIAQNGPGITNMVTPQAADKTIGQGGFQEWRCSKIASAIRKRCAIRRAWQP